MQWWEEWEACDGDTLYEIPRQLIKNIELGKKMKESSVVAHACNSSTCEVEAGGGSGVQSQPQRHSKLKVSLSFGMSCPFFNILFFSSYVYAYVSVCMGT